MPHCTQCGKQNPDTAKFCTGCGAVLSASAYNKQLAAIKKKKLILISSISIIILVIAGFFLLNRKKAGTDNKMTANSEDSFPQSFINKSSYPQPFNLNYFNSPALIKQDFNFGPSFFPIGFSKDGKFAWAEAINPGETNDLLFTIYIQSLESDKKLWQWSTTANFQDNSDINSFEKTSFKNMWAANNTMLTQKLNEHQIEPLAALADLKFLPIIQNGQTINLSVQNKWYIIEGNETEIASTKIILTADGVEKKTVFNKKYPKLSTGEYNGTDILVNRHIAGFLKNPFENRIAILLLDDYRGWEAGRYPQIQIVGCDLNTIN